MELTDEMTQKLVDGGRGERVEFDDPLHGPCSLVRTKLGYRLTVKNKPIIGPLQLLTEDTQSLTDEVPF